LLWSFLLRQKTLRSDQKGFVDDTLVVFARTFDPVHVIAVSIWHQANDAIISGSRMADHASNHLTYVELAHRAPPHNPDGIGNGHPRLRPNDGRKKTTSWPRHCQRFDLRCENCIAATFNIREGASPIAELALTRRINDLRWGPSILDIGRPGNQADRPPPAHEQRHVRVPSKSWGCPSRLLLDRPSISCLL